METPNINIIQEYFFLKSGHNVSLFSSFYKFNLRNFNLQLLINSLIH
jgi:hypothetical protein